MNKFTAGLRRSYVGKLLAIVLAGVMLVTTTACSNADSLGARPNNPPVQMGGQNNPHKMGGDGYSEYKMSTDREAVQNKRASLAGQLVATSSGTELQYRGADDSGSAADGRNQDKVTAEFQREVGRTPAEPQYEIDPKRPTDNVLERAGQTFKDATNFIKDAGSEVVDQPATAPNLNRSNPNSTRPELR
jgi:hypothetical protein